MPVCLIRCLCKSMQNNDVTFTLSNRMVMTEPMHWEVWSDLISCLRKQKEKSVSLTWNSIDFTQNIIENQRKCEKSIQEWDVWIPALRFLLLSDTGSCRSIMVKCADNLGFVFAMAESRTSYHQCLNPSIIAWQHDQGASNI